MGMEPADLKEVLRMVLITQIDKRWGGGGMMQREKGAGGVID